MKAETLKAIRKLLQTMQHREQIPAVQALAAQFITDDMVQELDRAIRHATEPVTFRFDVPGYVLIGQGADVYPRPDPKRDGLYFAHAVFEAGVAAQSIIRCEDWNKTPKAAAIALRRAAKWCEAEGCPALAVAIRGIKFPQELGFRPVYVGDIQVNAV